VKRFELEYIDLCLKHAKRKRISKARAFGLTGAWSYRCINRLAGGVLDVRTGERKGGAA
jgi:hypothetical protein